MAAALACLAFVLSFFDGVRHLLRTTGVLHDEYHLGLFALLGLLAARSSRVPWQRLALLGAAAMVGYGIEYVEAARFQSPIELNDVHTDLLGVALGGLIGWWTAPRPRQNL